jgi:hypothetical protein
MKEWRQRHPERSKAHSYAQYERQKEKPDEQRLKYSRKWFQNHKELQGQRTAAWKLKNREKFNAYMLAYHKAKYARDPNYRFACKIRSKIRLLLRGKRKSATTEQLLGCKISDFKSHLESLWEPWMSWDNYGSGPGTWQIDHILPVDSFDLSDPEQQQKCFHFSNHQPLCSKKNRDKWNKV